MKLAIVKLSALGDIIHASFLPQIIKNNIKNVTIDWFIEERFVEILKLNPYIDKIISVKLKEKNKIREIKNIFKYRGKYDKVIDLQGLLKTAFVSKILGKSYGFDKNSIREKIASFLYNETFNIPYSNNIIIRNFDLIKHSLNLNIGQEVIYKKQPSLFYSKTAEKNINNLLDKKRKNIVLIIGSSWKSKIYPKEKFLNIVKKIDANFLLSWGNEKEKSNANFIANNSKNAKKMPKINLDELKALIAKSDLTIGADSGPTHIAWALNKPSITIFGPTPSWRNTLQSKINIIVDCKKEINPLKINKKDICIQNIDENEIIQKAKRLLYNE